MEGKALRIVIAGRGCGACRELLARTREACAALSLPAEIEEVLEEEDALERFGLEHLPALLVEGRLVCQGFLPSTALLTGWLDAIARGEMPGQGGEASGRGP